MRFTSNLAPILTTVQKGNLFEERSMRILQDNLSMSLRRVGGKSDGGIDLMGWWWLPHSNSAADDVTKRRRLRVLAQCKAEKKKTGPNYVRELEGVMHRFMPLPNSSSNSESLVALLVSESPFTKSTLLRAQSSPLPFFLLHIPPIHGADEELSQIGTAVWNPALAGVNGLFQGQMEVRWERSLTGVGRPGLWCGGQRVQSWTPEGPHDELFLTDK
ncbi:hypothetical protein FB45DRAFT_1025169 [Roridomyces roridus]|uniref:Required for respiratory growth protein 7, mitochondrial n=1 Tax=Roridomyces roridus TaxID=1738132 RepID=A0AAD7C2G6_9AGAR|nr:hypothetical protein FB45DRAFT_1025169 [Roridomyces roridus]